ncbi:hypothetical protein [Actibacterium ureilyticum]|uniref:hypothetical protein n=1 Tax=Actibacterium ureilyticum TaxID=1590614 RepID=UPI0015955AFE|nr:hypothetical protein [Actibacterium ureilyticum]
MFMKLSRVGSSPLPCGTGFGADETCLRSQPGQGGNFPPFVITGLKSVITKYVPRRDRPRESREFGKIETRFKANAKHLRRAWAKENAARLGRRYVFRW